MKLIQFTVLLPVRNGWPYVEECVQSILNQTYPHFDLVILDNASTDQTTDWLATLTDPRVRVERSEEMLPIERSWKRIVDTGKRDYMTIIGHDDLFDPEYLSTIAALIKSYPDANLYQTSARLIDSEGRRIRACKPVPKEETGADYLRARFTFERDAFGTGFVMRAADYDRLGGIPPFERLFFADDALWLSLIADGVKVSDPQELFSVRVHPKSESASLPGVWRSLLKGLNEFKNFLDQHRGANGEVKTVIDQHAADFFLEYHQNVLIFALIEASGHGMAIEEQVITDIRKSLASCAPGCESELLASRKVAIIKQINALPLRKAVLILWRFYREFKSWLRSK